MLDKINEQIQKSLKPVTELASLNAKVLEQLAQQQSTLFTSLLNDSVALSEGASQNLDVKSLVEAQKNYVEGVQEKIVAASKEAYEVITSAQQKAGEVLKSAAEEAQSTVTAAANTAK